MIKKIAEEFEKQSRINTYNLLNNIKDLDYEVLQNKLILEHKNEKERKSITIFFSSYNKRIERISIDDTTTAWGNNIIYIDKYLNTKGVTAISEELYNKYWGVK